MNRHRRINPPLKWYLFDESCPTTPGHSIATTADAGKQPAGSQAEESRMAKPPTPKTASLQAQQNAKALKPAQPPRSSRKRTNATPRTPRRTPNENKTARAKEEVDAGKTSSGKQPTAAISSHPIGLPAPTLERTRATIALPSTDEESLANTPDECRSEDIFNVVAFI